MTVMRPEVRIGPWGRPGVRAPPQSQVLGVLEVVSAVLGHAGLAITADVYAKVGMDAKRRALATLADKV